MPDDLSALSDRELLAAPRRRRRWRRLRRAVPPAPRPDVRRRAAHHLQPRAGRGCRAGRVHLRVPARRRLPRRGRRHDLAAPHRRQRLPGPAAPRAGVGAPGRRPRRARPARPARPPRVGRDPPRRAEARSPGCPRASGWPWCSSTCTGCRSPRRPQVLGVAEGTVKSRCFRGREALAEHPGGPATAAAGRRSPTRRRRPDGTAGGPVTSHPRPGPCDRPPPDPATDRPEGTSRRTP